MVKAAVYARISSDDGTALGVTRQVEDCRKLAADLGWEVAEEYVDNDVSAYSGKPRPAYGRMLADIESGLRDAVIVYHVDRLTRRPIELEQFLEVLGRAGVTKVRFVSGGEFDLGSGDGLMVLRMLAAMAAHESSTKARRQARKNDEIAASGRPHGGFRRPFGYEDDKITVRPDEAEVLRQVVTRYLAGESLRSLAIWLDATGVRTVAGNKWLSSTLRGVLRAGRIAGLREHRGEVVGPAIWEPIITIEERDRILDRMAQAATTKQRTTRKYLLSGLCRCSRCGAKLYSAPKNGKRRYVCIAGPDHGGGCGRLTVIAEPLEELVADAVLYRLDSPELAAALSGRASEDAQTAALSDSLGEDRMLLDELARLLADRQIAMREWMTARKPIEDRIADTERRLARLTRTGPLTGLVGTGTDLRTKWEGVALTSQAAIVAAIVDRVVVAPALGSRVFDPNRVEIIWRL